jgi:hypothetical protein
MGGALAPSIGRRRRSVRALRKPSPPWVLLPPKSPKIPILGPRFRRRRRQRRRRPQLLLRPPPLPLGRGPGPCRSAQAPPSQINALSPLRPRFFETVRCGSGRHFCRTWICCTFLSRAFWTLGNWLPLTKFLPYYMLLSVRYGRRKMRCLQITVAALLPPPRAGRRRWRRIHCMMPWLTS